MVQIIERSLPYGKLAENFGRNLGESLGTQAQKELTARGIEGVSQRLKGDEQVSDLDLYTQLLRIPGMDPQQAQQTLPFLRESMVAQDLIGDRQRGPSLSVDQLQDGPVDLSSMMLRGGAAPLDGKDADTVSPLNREQPDSRSRPRGAGEKEILGFNPKTLTTLSAINTARESIPVVTEEMIDQKAGELLRSNRKRFPTVERARDYARASLEQQVSRKKEILNRRGRELQLTKDAREELDIRLQKQLGTNFLKDLDRSYSRIHDLAEQDVESGKLTPEGAAKKYAKIAEDFQKAQKDLMKIGTESVFGAPSDKMQSQIKQSRKAFEDTNSLDLFAETLESQNGLSPHMARTMAYPPKKELSTALDKIKMFVPTGQYGTDDKRMAERSRSEAEKIVPLLGPDESIYSVALEFNNKRLDENIFYDVLENAANAGEWTPSNEQQRELTSREAVEFTLPDILFGWLGGFLGKKTQTPTSTKIARTLFKKR